MAKRGLWCGLCCHTSQQKVDIKQTCALTPTKQIECASERIESNHNAGVAIADCEKVLESKPSPPPPPAAGNTDEVSQKLPPVSSQDSQQPHAVKFAETTTCLADAETISQQATVPGPSESNVRRDFFPRPSWTFEDSPYLTGRGTSAPQMQDMTTHPVVRSHTLHTGSSVQSDHSPYNSHTPTSKSSMSSSHHYHHPTFFLPRISTDPTDCYVTSRPYDSNWTVMRTAPLRRGSMIVRSGRTTTGTAVSTTPESGIPATIPGTGTAGLEGFIVTPFAQVLVSMQRIRNAFIRLTSAQSSQRFGVISTAIPEPGSSDLLQPGSSEYKALANETVEELEWCLKQLENIQTKRPVSDMAFSKFKRLLNKELNSFGESDKSRNEISAYICGTFLEDEKDAQANQEIEQMLERRRSSGQSHCSGGAVDQADGSPADKPSDPHTPRDLLLTGRHSNQHGSGPGVAGMTANVTTAGLVKDKVEPRELPVNGIVTPNDKELDDRFTQTLDTWGADIFEIDRLSGGHALTTTAYRIFQRRDLLRIFEIDPTRLIRYLLLVESNYHSDVPYHNALHAADVTQTSHYLLQAEPLEDVFSDLEILAVIFASAVHDVDHPGVTNQFLINTGHDLALQYNDVSVLENHHLYVAFKLLNQPDCDIFTSLSSKKRQTLRRMVIELVLATDMSKHMSLLADLRTMVETKKVSGSGLLNLDNYSDRIQILQNMIHCADLSNPAKPLRLNRKWTERLMEEFFRQGDKERKLKLEISPMCDRESVAVEKSQVTFIDFVAHPLLESWCDLVYPSAQVILDILADNRDWYESQADAQKSTGVTKMRPRLATAEEDDEDQPQS